MKKLKKPAVYNEISALAFTDIPNIRSLREMSGIKAVKGYSDRYRIRTGIEIHGDTIEIAGGCTEESLIVISPDYRQYDICGKDRIYPISENI